MKQISKSTGRGLALVVAAVFVFALASFALFSVVGQRSASPAAAPTATRTPEPTTVFGPLPTKPPFPTAVPRFTSAPTPVRSPTPESTPLPSIVTSWVPYQSKSGFSFLYPSGWDVRETYDVIPAAGPDQVGISIVNFRTKGLPSMGLIPGAMKIELLSYDTRVPSGGTPFAVGPQQLPGFQFVEDSSPAEAPPFVARAISIHFTAGKRQWVIAGYFSAPREGLPKNAEIFYQVIRSLRYEKQP